MGDGVRLWFLVAVWSFATGGAANFEPSLTADGILLIPATDSYLYALVRDSRMRVCAHVAGDCTWLLGCCVGTHVGPFLWLMAVTIREQKAATGAMVWRYSTANVRGC